MKRPSLFRSLAGKDTIIWLMIAMAAAALYLTATASGIGLPSDSFFYLGGTEGILAGEGFARPAADGTWKVITHFPPLYSAILVIPFLFFQGASAAKILNLILFAGNTVLGGLLIKRVTGMSWLGWLISLAWMLSPVLIEQHTSALSEALFLTIILLILFAFQAYLENGQLRALLAAGLFCSLAYLTRYAGAAIILPGILLPFFAKGERIKVRIFETLLFLASGVIPPLVWAGRNLILTGSSSNRVLAWHPISSIHVFRAADTMRSWLIPLDLPGRMEVGLMSVFLLAIAVLLVIAARCYLLKREIRVGFLPRFIVLPAAGIAAYLILLGVSISLFDASTPLDNRILSPVYALALILGFTIIGYFLDRVSLKTRQWMTAGVLLLIAWIGILGLRSVRNASINPVGFANSVWENSPAIDFVRNQVEDQLLYSNEIDGLYLLTGRMAYLIPVQWDPVTLREREDFEVLMAKMRSFLAEENGCLVLFPSLQGQHFFPEEIELAEGLDPVLISPSGSVYCAE